MNISAVLLAGGESRRMGEDKATLIFNGEPLWRRQLETLRNLEAKEIFVSGRIDPSWRPSDAEFVSDNPAARGPLSGIAATLARIRTDHLIVLAIDMPFMTDGYLRLLLAQIAPGCGVVPFVGERAEPLAAIYPRDVDVDLTGAIGRSEFSLQHLVRSLLVAGKLRAVTVEKENEILFRNLNEPADINAVTQSVAVKTSANRQTS